MKYCSKCGSQVEAESNFCNNCGASLNTNNYDATNNYTRFTTSKRDIVTAIVLTFVTCGIYNIIWFVGMNDDANKISNSNDPSGVVALLLTIITCGIYGIYWYYRMGQKLYIAGKTYNKDINDNSVLYLVLGLFGLGIVSYCLIQNDLNKFAE